MKPVNRRDFLKLTGSSIVGLTVGGVALRANAQEQLSTDDPMAKALQYVHESKVDGADCNNCIYIQGKDGDEWRPCALFPSNTVKGSGWCSAWMKKG